MKKALKLCLSFLLPVSCLMPMVFNTYAMEVAEVESDPISLEVCEMRNDLLEIGVSADKVDTLIAKLQDGELLDSMKEEYADMEPTSVIRLGNDFIQETYEYPDGSVKQTRVSEGVFTGSISGGNYDVGSYYYTWTGAKVFATWGVVTASYYADFEGTQYSSKINNVYDVGIVTAGGTFSNVSLTIPVSSFTSSTPARSQLFFIGTVASDFGQATFYLRLYVPQNASAYARLSVLN